MKYLEYSASDRSMDRCYDVYDIYLAILTAITLKAPPTLPSVCFEDSVEVFEDI